MQGLFGPEVVDGLDLAVESGELFGFLGPNGAGKTTSIRILTTLTKPTSGQVWINGIDVVRDPARVKSEFGIVQQHLSLNRDLTIAENLELHARLHHLSRADRKKRIAELLEYVELSDHADYLVDDVSGSMKMGKALIGVVRSLISSVAFLVVALLIAPNMHVGPLFLAGLVLTCLTFSFLRPAGQIP